MSRQQKQKLRAPHKALRAFGRTSASDQCAGARGVAEPDQINRVRGLEVGISSIQRVGGLVFAARARGIVTTGQHGGRRGVPAIGLRMFGKQSEELRTIVTPRRQSQLGSRPARDGDHRERRSNSPQSSVRTEPR